MRVFAVLLIVTALALAGCSSSGENPPSSSTSSSGPGSSSGTSGPGSSSASSSGTSGPAANRAPTALVTSSVTVGIAPLLVNFTMTGSDPDGDALTWRLSYGDGTSEATGSTLPASGNHTFLSAGNYTVQLTVTDGKLSTSSTVSIAVQDASFTLPPPVTFTGTATGVCGDAGFILSLMEADCYPEESIITHPFTMPIGVKGIVVSLTWTFPAAGGSDLDLYLLDQGSNEVADSACANTDPAPNPEIPMFGPFFSCVRGNSEEITLVDLVLAADQTWSAVIYPYQAPEVDYSLTITYS